MQDNPCMHSCVLLDCTANDSTYSVLRPYLVLHLQKHMTANHSFELQALQLADLGIATAVN